MASIFSDVIARNDSPRLILHSKINGDPNYSWVTGLLEINIDEFVSDSLNQASADSNTSSAFAQRYSMDFNPAYVAENLSASLDLLNRALLRRTEIQGLESQAITLAFQYLLEDQQRADQFKIARLQVLHAAAGSNEKPDSYLQALDRQKAIQEAAFLSRLKSHTDSGSALNFSERVSFLKGLLLTDMRAAWQRIKAVDLAFGQITPPDSTSEWPSLQRPAGTPKDLITMLSWVMECTNLYSAIRQREYEVVLGVRLAELVPDLSKKLIEFLHQPADPEILFSFNRSDIWPDHNVQAIVGIDMVWESGSAIIWNGGATTAENDPDKSLKFAEYQDLRNEDRRRTRTISAKVKINLPEQTGNGKKEAWKCAPLFLTNVSLHGEGRSIEHATFSESNQVGRIIPDGNWSIIFQKNVDCGAGTYTLMELLTTGRLMPYPLGPLPLQSVEPSLISITLFFRCICR